jgi:hypothetical protein
MVLALEIVCHLFHSDEFNTFVLLEMLNEPAIMSVSVPYRYARYIRNSHTFRASKEHVVYQTRPDELSWAGKKC